MNKTAKKKVNALNEGLQTALQELQDWKKGKKKLRTLAEFLTEDDEKE